MAEGRLRRAVNLGLVGLLLAVGVTSFERARTLEYDFSHFYLDARYVWEHGALNPDVRAFTREPGARQLLFYLPAVPVVLAPLTAFGLQPAALAWAALQVASLGFVLRALRRWMTDRAFLVAVVVALPAIWDAARFNQLSFPILALLVAAVVALERRRCFEAGALLGLAAVIKLLPVIFVPWLLLTRRYVAAVGFVLAALVLALVPPLVAFGAEQTRAYHADWWAYNAQGASAGGLLNRDAPEHFIDHRNESISQVLARWTWPDHPWRAPWQPLALSATAVQQVSRGGALLLLLLLLTFTHGSRALTSTGRLRAEFAAYCIALAVLSPLLRTYYFVWSLPALVLLAACAVETSRNARRLGLLGLLVWTGGMVAWIWPLPRLLGVHLFMLIALTMLTLLASRRERSDLGPA
jgi:alpha-1,2-mannosyltransferase